MNQEKVIVIDFGGQYNQLVARRVRECNVYCEIYSYKIDLAQIKAMNPKGIILTGGPNSCYQEDSPSYQKELFELGIPVLGLCYGAQLMMHKLGGKVITPEVGEYGKTQIHYAPNGVLYEGELKKDFIDDALTEYNEIYAILGSNTLARLPQLTKDMSLIICAITKESNYGSILPTLPSFLTTLSSDSNAIPMRQDYDDIHIDENTVSAFNIKRREVIINTIVTTLDEKINNHNRYADMMGVTYDFYLPEIDDAEWINAVDDVSVMAFMQGIPIGTDSYYNSFALGGSRIVKTNYIYELTTDDEWFKYYKKL